MTRIVLIAALATAALPSITACARAEAAPSPEPQAPAIDIQSAEVVERSMPRTLLLTGTLAASRESDVASDAAGKVVKTFVERGDIVKKGAVLARLDASESAMAAAEAGASATAAEAQAKNARLECDRAEQLFGARAISRSEYDRMKTSCETSTSSSQAARARAARASKEVSDALIRAPFSGVVVERYVTVGEFVGPGAKIATLVERDPMRLVLDVPESAVGKLAMDQKLRFSVAPVANESFGATIRYLGPVLDQRSRNLRVEALIDSEDQRLRPGMFATTRLITGTTRGLAIPLSALTGIESSRRVFVVQDGHVQERVIQTGERDGDFVAVQKGLAKGERVVRAPSSAIRDGVAVK